MPYKNWHIHNKYEFAETSYLKSFAAVYMVAKNRHPIIDVNDSILVKEFCSSFSVNKQNRTIFSSAAHKELDIRNYTWPAGIGKTQLLVVIFLA